MVQQIEGLAKKAQFAGYGRLAEELLNVADHAKADNLPGVLGRGQIWTPEVEERVLQRQAGIVWQRVAEPLGINRTDFARQLPEGFPERPDVSGVFPLLVPQFKGLGFTWQQAVERGAGVEISRLGTGELAVSNSGLWSDPRGIETPDKFYTTWVFPRSRQAITAEEARRLPVLGRREGNHWDALGLALVYPGRVRRDWWSLPGSTNVANELATQIARSFGLELVSCIYLRWWNGPNFNAGIVDIADPVFQPLRCTIQSRT